MSKANSEVKVLTTALKRIENGRWGQGSWFQKGTNVVTGRPDYLLCLEGTITGGSSRARTDAQCAALERMRDVMLDLHGSREIPFINDRNGFTFEMAVEVVKESLRRAKAAKAARTRFDGPDISDLTDLTEEQQTEMYDVFSALVDESVEPDFSGFLETESIKQHQ